MSRKDLIAQSPPLSPRFEASRRGNLPSKIWKCPDTLADLPPADGLMLIDPNWGVAEMTLFSVDPAVVDDHNGMKLGPALDMFRRANGFSRSGSHYSQAFVDAFLGAQGKRSNAILARASARLKVIEAGQGDYEDDEPFVVPGANLLSGDSRLFSQDVDLMSHTRQAWPLLKGDGTVVTQVVHSVRVPENAANLTRSYVKGALKRTVGNYLNTYAIRVSPDFGYDADSVQGVDWKSTYARPPGNVEGVSVPLLTLGMTGHWEFLASETIYDLAASQDKTLAFVEGATHLYTTCRKCERRPGEFGDPQATTYDYIDR